MLALGRALMLAPKILLIDEPSVGLAPLLVARTIDAIKQLKDRHQLTVLMAEQNFTQAMRIADRGLIREGLWADVVIFDYDKIQDRSTYEHPNVTPDGIDFVLVNGQVVIDHGKHTGVRPGKVLYGPGFRK